MRILAVVWVLAAACSSEDPLDPATCPEAPFESCGHLDGGWDAWCEDGVVWVGSLQVNWYCAPGTTERVCEVEDDTPREAHACAGSCSDPPGVRHYLETVDELMAFDSASLCDDTP